MDGGGGGGGQWAPHGRQLTAGLVLLNVFVVGLIYYYLWRFFTGKNSDGDGDGDGDDDVDDVESPKAREDRQAMERAITALPVFVVHIPKSESDSGNGGGGGGGGECAICITEFADGEEGRLLPRCGHRFHVRCVDMWFQLHSTCPLCRAGVLPPPAATAQNDDVDGEVVGQPPTDTNTHTDCPV